MFFFCEKRAFFSKWLKRQFCCRMRNKWQFSIKNVFFPPELRVFCRNKEFFELGKTTKIDGERIWKKCFHLFERHLLQTRWAKNILLMASRFVNNNLLKNVHPWEKSDELKSIDRTVSKLDSFMLQEMSTPYTPFAMLFKDSKELPPKLFQQKVMLKNLATGASWHVACFTLCPTSTAIHSVVRRYLKHKEWQKRTLLTITLPSFLKKMVRIIEKKIELTE